MRGSPRLGRRSLLRSSIAVAALATVSGIHAPAALASTTFTDVLPGSQFYTEIMWAADQGISTGWPEPDGTRTYRPLLPINRDAMASFLYRMSGSPSSEAPPSSPFRDVAPQDAFFREICWLAAAGITTGWAEPDGTHTFRPLEPIARDAMAAFLFRFAGSPSYTPPTTSYFEDVPESAAFFTEVSWLASKGISTGWPTAYGCRTFRPSAPVNRDAMAAFLHRLVNGATAIPAGQCQPTSPTPEGFVASITPVIGGVPLRLGWNGTRVYLTQRRLGMERFGSDQTFDTATRDAVIRFQRAQGLAADGVVGPKTWASLDTGWLFDSDAYQVQPRLPLTARAGDRVETMVAFALDQRGSRYTWGGAGPYQLGFDCSGLVLQAIYAAGKDPQPIDVIKHAEPTYRTSRELYAYTGFQSVPVAQRRRGDLIFYTNAAGTVHHVAIDLGDGTMMEAYGRYAAVRTVSVQYGSSYIAPFVKRVFWV